MSGPVPCLTADARSRRYSYEVASSLIACCARPAWRSGNSKDTGRQPGRMPTTPTGQAIARAACTRPCTEHPREPCRPGRTAGVGHVIEPTFIANFVGRCRQDQVECTAEVSEKRREPKRISRRRQPAPAANPGASAYGNRRPGSAARMMKAGRRRPSGPASCRGRGYEKRGVAGLKDAVADHPHRGSNRLPESPARSTLDRNPASRRTNNTSRLRRSRPRYAPRRVCEPRGVAREIWRILLSCGLPRRRAISKRHGESA